LARLASLTVLLAALAVRRLSGLVVLLATLGNCSRAN
jgi:hypothetical protein